MHYVIARIHTEITVNTYMQHIHAIPITIKTVITTHRINPQNKHVNNNAACKFITVNTYLSKNITNFVQTFHEPPSLRPPCSSLSAVDHPRAGTKLHSGKGVPN